MPTNMPPKPTMPAASSAPSMGGKAGLGLVCLVAGLLVGYGAGRVSTGTPVNPLSDKKGGYEEGYRAAMQKVDELGLLPPTPLAATSLSGSVKGATANGLTLEVDLRTYDPLGLKDLARERTVTVTAETELVRVARISQEELAAAQRAFAAAMADFQPDPENPVTPPSPPSPFREETISLSDIRPGDQVSVEAAEDVLGADTFVAVRVTVLPETADPAEPEAPVETPSVDEMPTPEPPPTP